MSTGQNILDETSFGQISMDENACKCDRDIIRMNKKQNGTKIKGHDKLVTFQVIIFLVIYDRGICFGNEAPVKLILRDSVF